MSEMMGARKSVEYYSNGVNDINYYIRFMFKKIIDLDKAIRESGIDKFLIFSDAVHYSNEASMLLVYIYSKAIG
jgi:hypothetical protein